MDATEISGLSRHVAGAGNDCTCLHPLAFLPSIGGYRHLLPSDHLCSRSLFYHTSRAIHGVSLPENRSYRRPLGGSCDRRNYSDPHRDDERRSVCFIRRVFPVLSFQTSKYNSVSHHHTLDRAAQYVHSCPYRVAGRYKIWRRSQPENPLCASTAFLPPFQIFRWLF